MSKAKIGKKKSKEHVEKLREKSKVKILCVENNKIYESIENAATELNLNRCYISLCLNNKIDSCNDYHFSYISDIKCVIKTCIFCGNEYKTQRKNSKYCSNKCTTDYYKKIGYRKKNSY